MKILLLLALATFGFSAVYAKASCLSFDKVSRLNQLTELQYDVTQNAATEKPFNNLYWNNHDDGIYVDIVSGEALFSSKDKYESGTGWPSFSKPISSGLIRTKEDRTWYLAKRTEVLSACSDSHLGHVFDDGPAPTGQRYCLNSAALRFVPVSQMQEEGYSEYLYLFD